MPDFAELPAGFSLEWFSEIESTNVELVKRALGGAPEGLVLAADFQTQGKGRRGRTWEAPAGQNLLFSVLLRPSCPVEYTGWLTPMAALAVMEVCDVLVASPPPVAQHGSPQPARLASSSSQPAQPGGRHSLGSPQLKWPNDVLWADQKLAGILAELVNVESATSVVDATSVDATSVDASGVAVVLGVGLNVNWAPPEAVSLSQIVAKNHAPPAPVSFASPAPIPSVVPPQAPNFHAPSAQSRASTLHGPPAPPQLDRVEILSLFLNNFAVRYAKLGQSNWAANLREETRSKSATLGKQVRVKLADKELTGTAVDINEVGYLLLLPTGELADGELADKTSEQATLAITAGEVEHIRAIHPIEISGK